MSENASPDRQVEGRMCGDGDYVSRRAARERVKTWVYVVLSALLLFTAAIVLNIESVQQTVNLILNAAYIHAFAPIDALIWIRSLAIVLLIVTHVMRHVQMGKN